MATKIAAPSKRLSAPSKLAAPSKPGKPGVKASSAAAVPPAPKSAPKLSPAVGAPSKREAELTAQLVAMKGELAALVAAAKTVNRATEGRSAEEITDGAEKLVEKGDWRLRYQGHTLHLKAFTRSKQSGPIALNSDAPNVKTLLAIPRDVDGPFGADGRSQGYIALHYRTNEAGEFVGAPNFVSEAELAAIWPDDE